VSVSFILLLPLLLLRCMSTVMPRQVKVVVLGNGGVGKSALTVQFVSQVFLTKYDPTIEDCYEKSVEVDGEQYNIEIQDTAGTEQFTAVKDVYMRTGQGFLLVYSISSLASFTDLSEIKDQICRVKDIKEPAIVLVGNKTDLIDQRVITTERGQELADKWGCAFVETSAKTRQNVSLVFDLILKQIALKEPRQDPSASKSKDSECCVVV